ncbi:MAG: hypothetical protein NVSMB62_06460 [Acidobacteriaceae bacterium]
MIQKLLPAVLVATMIPAFHSCWSQAADRSLRQREVPCQAQYAQAVQTIGVARWSAPEPERPAIERLLNAAAKAKELVDSSFLQWEAPLCSSDTLAKLHTSVDRLQANRWLPETAQEKREAEATAVNAELLKAMDAGFDEPATTSSNTGDLPESRVQRQSSAN